MRSPQCHNLFVFCQTTPKRKNWKRVLTPKITYCIISDRIRVHPHPERRSPCWSLLCCAKWKASGKNGAIIVIAPLIVMPFPGPSCSTAWLDIGVNPLFLSMLARNQPGEASRLTWLFHARFRWAPYPACPSRSQENMLTIVQTRISSGLRQLYSL